MPDTASPALYTDSTTVVVPPPLLIGLGGLKTAGKDEVARSLARSRGFARIGMSDPLHQAMLTLDAWVDVPKNDIYGKHSGHHVRYTALTGSLGYEKAKTIPEYRRLLQVFGSEVGRDLLGSDLWVRVAKRTIGRHFAMGESVAVTGIRFPNEVEMIHDLGGHLVWVDRPSLARTDVHQSETNVGPDDFDFVLVNDSTLGELDTRALLLADTLTVRHV
jgi:hypothetical protein